MTATNSGPLQVIALAANSFVGRMGVAVSGGSDSMALLVAAAEALGPEKVAAVTVDHGLRAESAAEAAKVAEICSRLGAQHQILTWSGWDGKGNLPDQARRARYALIEDWASTEGISAVALGHTADDQAETFVMRLSRRSGLAGLAGMPPARAFGRVTLLRPFLTLRREALRDFLRSNAIAWIDDPTNDDESFDRVRIRTGMSQLEMHGIGADVLADVSRQLADARAVVDRVAHEFLVRHCLVDEGDVLISRKALSGDLPEIRRRVLSHSLNWVSGADYGPRSEALARALVEIDLGRDTVLHGCLVLSDRKNLRLCREFKAVENMSANPGEIWDGRWRLHSPHATGSCTVRALGADGLLDCPDWRGTGRPRASLLATPAVWQQGRLVSAPLAGYMNGWSADLSPAKGDFHSSILSR